MSRQVGVRSRNYRAGLAITIGCGVLFLASVGAMALRIRDYYQASPPPQFYFRPTLDRSFTIRDRRVDITDEKTPDGRPAVRVKYGDQEQVLPIASPPLSGFKDLSVYEESLRVLAFAPLKQGQVDFDERTSPVRFIVVSRTPAPGHETEPAGLVGTKLWTFEIVEFMPDGSLPRRTVQFRDRKGNLPAAKADPASQVEPIEERSWEWQAALWAMPKLYASRYKYKVDAVTAMGWTLPGAGFGMLGVMIGAGLLMAARIERQAAAAASPAPSPQ